MALGTPITSAKLTHYTHCHESSAFLHLSLIPSSLPPSHQMVHVRMDTLRYHLICVAKLVCHLYGLEDYDIVSYPVFEQCMYAA